MTAATDRPWDAPGEVTVHSMPRYGCINGKPCEDFEILEYNLETNRGVANLFGILVLFEGRIRMGDYIQSLTFTPNPVNFNA